MLDVLVVAVMRLSHAALRAQAARGQGGVINVSSVAAYLPRGTYGAAKAWVNQFGLWAAAEYRSRGVTVTTLCPGFTKTEFHQRMGVRRGTGFLWLEPEFVVERALADFDRGRAVSIPGRQYRAIVGATRLVPSRALQTYQSIGRR
jgi:short-subunit dehydrogenase